MHYLYFVAVPKTGTVEDYVSSAKDADEAVSIATQELDNNHFAGEGGYFSSPKSDWYCVGGRWATYFTQQQEWAKQAYKEIDELRKEKKWLSEDGTTIDIVGTHYGDEETTKKQKALREQCEMIWAKHRPTDYPKVRYDRYANEDGETSFTVQSVEDCAVLLTDTVAKSMLELERQWKEEDKWGSGGAEVFVIQNDGDYSEQMVGDFVRDPEVWGKYWLVIIDYHN